MSRKDYNDDYEEDLDEDLDMADDRNEEEEGNKKKGGFFSTFAISAIVHTLLIGLLVILVIPSQEEKKKDIIITTQVIEELPEEEPQQELERDVVKEKADVVVETNVVLQPIVTQDEVSDHMETENEMDTQTAEGVSDAISDLPLTGTGIMGNIGGGGGGGGAFGQRSGGGRRKAVLQGGGSRQTESAVDAALRWLMRHQEPDGSWNNTKYGDRDPRGESQSHSGLALLAFLAAGHTPRVGKYKDTVKKGLDWILSKQAADGSFSATSSHRIYDDAICTLALAEAFAMAPDPRFRAAGQKGVDFLLSAPSRYVHFGMSEGSPDSMSVMGWNLMALKSAKIAGLNVPDQVWKDYEAKLQKRTEKDQSGYMTRVHYLKFGDRQEGGEYGNTMTAVGMLLYEYLGYKRHDLDQMATLLLKNTPKWGARPVNNHDFYHWYYGTLAMFQYGGPEWKVWNEALIGALLPNQRKGGPLDGSLNDVDGSWDPVTRWGKTEGRVYTTAMGAFCLEVYYRYQSVLKH